MMHPVTLVALAILAALPPPAAAQVYKCKIGGTTVFSGQPCQPDAKPIDVRPASGNAPAPTIARPGATPPTISSASNPQAVHARMERDRRIRDLDYDIAARRSRINEEQSAMDRDLAALRAQKSRATNNLAGATWEKSISEEMNAVVARYNVRIRALEGDVARMESERGRMMGTQ